MLVHFSKKNTVGLRCQSSSSLEVQRLSQFPDEGSQIGRPSLLLNAQEKLWFLSLKIFVRKDLVHLVSLVRDRKLVQLNKSCMNNLKHNNDKNYHIHTFSCNFS